MRKCITVTIRKDVAVTAAVVLSAMTALAQDVPRVETFAGFTYLRANSATNVPAFSANGGGGQVVVNFSKWIGAVADIGAVHNGNIGGYHLDTTLSHYMFGPRIPIRKWSRILPYGQILFGGMHASSSLLIQVPEGVVPPPFVQNPIAPPVTRNENPAVTARATASQTAFAMALGGGLDIKLNKYVSFRPIGLDWMMTRLQNLRSLEDNNQHHLRYTTGINFMFGAQ
jgi:opacity protein-like surface antigen